MSDIPPTRPFQRVLIANRGEIALRIVRACRDAGLISIAVHADSDVDAPFVALADEATALAGTSAAETYLDQARVLAAARLTGAEAVHPGYGFLAEDAAFARAVIDNGLVWIGPPPQVIRDLGDKVSARRIAASAGVPLVAGSEGPVDDAAGVASFATEHGLPVVIKAAHGGGGRGMRIVRALDDIPAMFESAVREATAAFGRGECFVERLVERARHIEAQVVADAHGAIVVVGDRDCTLQRRHQKLVEEAPAPFLSDEQRRTVHESAVAICRAAGYVGVGTVEFLLGPDATVSFLEVNTRLQVEHPVTEEVAGVDLVREQFRIAMGERLGSRRLESPRRHAIELRITAEDPAAGFLPASGRLTRFEPPTGPGIRFDAGVRAGSVISDQFDSLLAKLIVVGADRDEALQRTRRALLELDVAGVPTVREFLRAAVDHPDFAASDVHGFQVHTGWVEEEFVPSDVFRRAVAVPAGNGGLAVAVGGRWLDVSVPGVAAASSGPLVDIRDRARERRARPAVVAVDTVAVPMQATVVRIAVTEGDRVETGDLIAVVEAMKMEHPLLAPRAGRVTGLDAVVGASVPHGAIICRVLA